MDSYSEYIRNLNEKIIEERCQKDIKDWQDTFSQETEEEQTVIVDEIYLIKLQSENTLLKNTLIKIIENNENCTCVNIAKEALEEIGL